MKLIPIALLVLFIGPAAYGREFRELTDQPKPQKLDCAVNGREIAIKAGGGNTLRLRPYEGGLNLKVITCDNVTVGKTRLYLVLSDRLVEEGSSPRWVRTLEIALSQNETSRLVTLRSETLDVIDLGGDPARRPLAGQISLVWGQSSRDQTLMVDVSKRSAAINETFILKFDSASTWLVNTFEELEPK